MGRIVLSMSQIKTFKECRKAYELGYVKNLLPFQVHEAADEGTTFHEYMRLAAEGKPLPGDDGNEPMLPVAKAYLAHHPLPQNIVGAEYKLVLPINDKYALRTTRDLVYERGDTRVLRDYKTFDRAPTLDLDLDFQGRLYIAAESRIHQGLLEFEYEYVRRTAPNVPKDKAGNCWTPEECYLRFPIIISQHEIDRTWQELLWTVEEIDRTTANEHWYRVDRKGWNGCQSCFYKDLCKAEYQLGYLDEQTIDLYAIQKQLEGETQ